MMLALLRTLADEAFSDGFAILVYESSQPDWTAAVHTVAPSAKCERVLVTSSRGNDTSRMSPAEFCVEARLWPYVFLSADWEVRGYAGVECEWAEGVSTERFWFATLEASQVSLLEGILARFESRASSGDRALVAVDLQGSSAAEEWVSVFRHGGEPPPAPCIGVSRIELTTPGMVQMTCSGAGVFFVRVGFSASGAVGAGGTPTGGTPTR